MKAHQHTPGEWVIDDGMVSISDQADYLKSNIGTSRQWACIGLNDHEGFAEVIALAHPMNAQLIAAAPELLATLERLLSIANDGAVMRHETGKPTWSFIDEVKTQARAAITKATNPQA